MTALKLSLGFHPIRIFRITSILRTLRPQVRSRTSARLSRPRHNSVHRTSRILSTPSTPSIPHCRTLIPTLTSSSTSSHRCRHSLTLLNQVLTLSIFPNSNLHSSLQPQIGRPQKRPSLLLLLLLHLRPTLAPPRRARSPEIPTLLLLRRRTAQVTQGSRRPRPRRRHA